MADCQHDAGCKSEGAEMTDDLVKRLRGWHDMPADAWFTTMETAADRIEKLEALVEQLRDDNSSIMDSFDEDILRQDDRIEKLEAALRSIAANACCDSCREAALVARKALEGKDEA